MVIIGTVSQRVFKLHKEEKEVVDMSTKHPRFSSLFESLQTTREAQLFTVFFLARRFLMGAVLIFIDKPSF
jgi:hypothetical protein